MGPTSSPTTTHRRHRSSALLAGACVLAATGLAVLAAMNPLLGLGGLVMLFAVAAFARSGAFAVSAFAATTYFDLVGQYTGPVLSPIKLAGGALIVVAALALVLRAQRGPGAVGRDPIAALLAGEAPGWRGHPMLVALLACFVAWALASAAWAVDLDQVRTLGTRLATDALIFLAVPVFLQRTGHLRGLGWTLLGSGTAATLLGWVLGADAVGRALGTFTDPNEYAAALAPAIAIGLALSESTSQQLARWMGRAMVATCLVGVVGSGSRGGLVALVVAFLVLLVTSRGRERVRMSGMLMLSIAAAFAWLAFTPTGATISERLVERDSSGRTDLWKVAMRQYADEPVRGVGLGNYPVLSPRYLEGDVHNLELFLRDPRVVHSTPLELLAELGTVGAALFALFVAGCLRLGMQAVRRARRLGDAALLGASRGLLAATASSLATMVFMSGQYQELAWVLLAACVSASAIARREAVRREAAAVLEADLLPVAALCEDGGHGRAALQPRSA